jgi:MazG family protein
LVELTAHLRGAQGCAWDRAQDFDSMKGMLLEEAYEVVDAVNARDYDGLEDELGDLLFLIVFYARLAEEAERFALADVMGRICAKLVRRHPHVFAGRSASTPEAALESWLAAKEGERKADAKVKTPSVLDGIPGTLPATLEAYELGVRAAEVKFDWRKVDDLLDKIEEELGEVRRALAGTSQDQRRRTQEEVGDLLFAASNLARYLRSDPETCLRSANQKFKRRFQALEAEIAKRGKQMRECTFEELDAIWEETKKRERSG